MLIRHKIIVSFILFTGLLLCLFSVYIYFASATSFRNSFIERIKNKALATKEIYEINNKVAERIITSLSEQSEYVFDENNALIFVINDMHDYPFDSAFFRKVKAAGEFNFGYRNHPKGGKKDGYAFVFTKGTRARTIVITAYDKSGYDNLTSLTFILIIGNVFFLAAIGFAAYAFSSYVFKPVNDLVTQAEAVTGSNIDFRLRYANPRDEIGIVAAAFNKALSRIQTLIRSQKSFISYASHELRTPLAAVNGILETSLNYDKGLAPMRESITAAHKEIQKATSLVNGLLQLAKIDASGEVADQTRLNLVDVLLDAISFYRLKKPGQEITFDIPDMAQDALVEVDGNSGLLRTAFINLIDNASKYSGQQKIDIKLDIESPVRISIKVIDRGIGIPVEDNKQVFEPFYRGTNANGFEGFGLGLPLTQRIFALHKGELLLTKNEFSGVTAYVTLPVAPGINAPDDDVKSF